MPAFTFISCKKSDEKLRNASNFITITPIDYDIFVKAHKNLKEVLFQKDELSMTSSLNEPGPLDTVSNPITPNVEIGSILAPVIAAGQDIHSQMISQLQGSSEWDVLTPEEKVEITNLNESGHAALAMLFTDSSSSEPPPVPEDNGAVNPDTMINIVTGYGLSIPTGVIRECVGVALGISEISSLITNTSKLMTMKGAIQLLKIMAKRYVSYIGIAWMVWDFTDCVAQITGPRQ